MSKNIFLISETEFNDVVHSLDIWHKSKSIKKCLTKVSKSPDLEPFLTYKALQAF